MIDEVLIHPNAVFFADIEPLSLRLSDESFALLQENDVRSNFRACIFCKCIIRQTNRAQKFGTLRQIFAHLCIFFIQRAFGSNKGDHTVWADFVQGFGEKVIVNEEIFLVVALVLHFKLPERHIADHSVEKVIRKIRALKALDLDIRLLVKHPGNAPAYFVQFHAVKTACAHVFRQSPEEIAHAAGRL